VSPQLKHNTPNIDPKNIKHGGGYRVLFCVELEAGKLQVEGWLGEGRWTLGDQRN